MSFKLRFRAVRASNRPYYGVIFLRTGWTWQNLKAERHRYRLRRFYGLGQAFDQTPGVPLGLGRPQFISATGGQSHLKSCDEQLLAARPSSYIRHYSPWLSRDPEVHQCACWHVGTTRAARLGSCYLPTRNLRRQRAVTGPNNETKSSTVAKPKGSAMTQWFTGVPKGTTVEQPWANRWPTVLVAVHFSTVTGFARSERRGASVEVVGSREQRILGRITQNDTEQRLRFSRATTSRDRC
ncbi:hypothetical protein C8J57DRAFT_1251348 [Mycena rebaudengoi]|nr:hypothetical protein C8J57DRAFT_1251348 [Mycena rebaudengoi]